VLTVHHLDKSRSHRIVWLLEELGASYAIERYARVGRTGAAPEALKRIHPLGKSPVLTEGGAVIAESGAIIDYILRRHGNGALHPPLDSALYDQFVHWLHYAEGSAALPLTMKGTVDHLGNTWRPLKRMVDTEVALHLSYIDGQLEKGTYLLGDAFSAADIQLSFIGEIAGVRVDRSAYPHLDRWVRMLQERPAYQRARTKAGE
jgi:glutathione S-transferase